MEREVLIPVCLLPDVRRPSRSDQHGASRVSPGLQRAVIRHKNSRFFYKMFLSVFHGTLILSGAPLCLSAVPPVVPLAHQFLFPRSHEASMPPILSQVSRASIINYLANADCHYIYTSQFAGSLPHQALFSMCGCSSKGVMTGAALQCIQPRLGNLCRSDTWRLGTFKFQIGRLVLSVACGSRE